jgi:hypothetical protein
MNVSVPFAALRASAAVRFSAEQYPASTSAAPGAVPVLASA